MKRKAHYTTLSGFVLIFFVIILRLLCNNLYAAEAEEIELFSKIVKTNSGIKSVNAEIIQYIDTPEHSKEVFKGRYFADNKGRFRINYSAPYKQIVLNNGSVLYWYFPDENILYTLGNKNPTQSKPKVNPLQEFNDKNFDKQFQVTYNGKHFYGFFNTAHEFFIKDIKNELKFDIRVDSQTNALLSKTVMNSAGQEIIKEIYENYKNINNILFPARIDIHARTGKGVTRNTTEYSNIHLNFSLPDSLFQIKFPENVTKKYLQ